MCILIMCIFLITRFTNHPFCVYIINSQRISCTIYITSNISCVLHTHRQCHGCSHLAWFFTGMSATYWGFSARTTYLGCWCFWDIANWKFDLVKIHIIMQMFLNLYIMMSISTVYNIPICQIFHISI